MTELVRRRGQDAAALTARFTEPEQVAARWLATYRSANTRAAYYRDLVLSVGPCPSFLQWCHEVDVDPWTVDRDTITVWLRSLDPLGLSAATTARKVSAVRGFYAFAVETARVMPGSPVPPRNRSLHLDPIPDESTTRGLTRAEVAAMLRAARHRSARDAAIIATLYHQGLRASELCDLDTGDVGHDTGHRTLTVHGKGRRSRTLPLAPPAAAELDRYLADRVAQGLLDVALVPTGTTTADRPLFPDHHTGERLGRFQVRDIVLSCARKGGLHQPTTVTPHCLRHSCTTHLLEAEVPMRDVQRFLGHARPDTTAAYDRRRGQLSWSSPAYRLPGLLDDV